MTSSAEIGVVRIQNRVLGTNTYICPCSTPGTCILVDPGLDRDAIEAKLGEIGLVPVAVFCTHGHFDHLGSADHFRTRFGVPVHLHAADVRVANASNFLMMAFGLEERIVVPRVDVLVEEPFERVIGGDRLHVLHSPGHTPGSTVLLFRGQAFTGDTLYASGVGLVSLPGEDEALLRTSLRRIWNELPDTTPVHPGHGDGATLAEIELGNEPLRRFLAADGAPSGAVER